MSDEPAAPPPLPRGPVFLLAAVWALALVGAGMITRELAYFCSVPPPFSWFDWLWLIMSFVAGVLGLGGGVLGVAPISGAGRLGAVTLSATITSLVVLSATPVGSWFGLGNRLILGGYGTVFVSLPAAWLVWGIAELGGLAWVRARR